jgi:hypothetical protein
MLPDQVQHHSIGWEIAILRHFAQDGLILAIIEIVMVLADVEEMEVPQAEGLVYLEIKADVFHYLLFVIC